MDTEKELYERRDGIMRQIDKRQRELNEANDNVPTLVEDDAELNRLDAELGEIDEKLISIDPF